MGYCCLVFKFDIGFGRILVKMEKFCIKNNKENFGDFVKKSFGKIVFFVCFVCLLY